MEVLRILMAQGLKPRRTIRLALWDAEEPSEDYAGSIGYVRRHLADPKTGKRLPAYGDFSAYLNLDNGSGKIRGIYLQGNQAARPLFESLLAPFADLGANHVTLAATGETDHISFIAVGLPGFQFIQDPLDYLTRTHHSHLDTGDYLVEDDLKQAATVMASVVYHLAMRDSLVPRR
jgi:Zn-dependent M28 family amino/carboxypeptidase